MAEMRSLPYWDEFLADVERLNGFVAPKRLLQYQRELLDAAGFDVVSPVTGEKVRITTSRIGHGRFAYRLGEDSRSWLVTGMFADHFALTYFGFDSELAVCGGSEFQPDSARGKLEREFLEMEPLVRHSGFIGSSGDGPQLVLMIGHVNFAQYLWNELSALEEWMHVASDEAIARLTVVPRFEPLGPLDKIFPQLKKAQFFRGSLRNQNTFLESARLIVRPSSIIVSKRIRERIVEYCGAAPPARAWPRVWISVRTGSRTPDNQAGFIVASIDKILDAYPDAEFLLDGFSFPIDFDNDVRLANFRKEFKTRPDDCEAAIEEIIGEARRVLGPSKSARISSVSGITVTDAIAAAGTCHYYICHSGTLQHKIGWLHKIPGIIHSPTVSRVWYANQVEDGVTPDELPMEFIASSTTPTTALNLPRNFNYVITDIDKAADAVVAAMEGRLQPA